MMKTLFGAWLLAAGCTADPPKVDDSTTTEPHSDTSDTATPTTQTTPPMAVTAFEFDALVHVGSAGHPLNSRHTLLLPVGTLESVTVKGDLTNFMGKPTPPATLQLTDAMGNIAVITIDSVKDTGPINKTVDVAAAGLIGPLTLETTVEDLVLGTQYSWAKLELAFDVNYVLNDHDADGDPFQTDCDDLDPTRHSLQDEIPHNGIDDDCNGDTLDDDLDQDGFGWTTDCNDLDAAINPKATPSLWVGDFRFPDDGDPCANGDLGLTGNLSIGADARDLQALSCLCHIEGSLTIEGAHQVQTLSGLETVRSVGGDVVVRDSSELLDISALNGLQTVGGNLILDVGANPSFAGLRRVEGDLQIGTYLFDQTNGGATQLDGFPVLQTVGGHLVVEGQRQLTHLEGFAQLESIGGDFRFRGNPSLTLLEGFARLQTVGGAFGIEDNETLRHLTGFSALASLGNLNIETNLDLQSVVLPSLQSATEVRIRLNPDLRFIEGWQDFSTCETLGMTSLPSLHQVSIPHLQTITDAMAFHDLPNLKTLDLRSLTTIGFAGFVGSPFGFGNDTLEHIDLGSLTTVRARLTIWGNPMLETLDGFAAIEHVGGLNVSNNATLENLDGLSLLRTVYADVEVVNNERLNDVTGIHHLQDVGGDVFVLKNPELTAAQLDDLEKAISDAVNGYIDIGSGTN